MITLDKNLLKDLRDRNVNVQELADFIARNYTVYDIAMDLAERIIKDKASPAPSKIVVTEEEYRTLISLFRVKGFKEDGTADKRGRPKNH